MSRYIFFTRNYNKDNDKNIHKALRGPGSHLHVAVHSIIPETPP